MKKYIAVFLIAGFVLTFAYGCASTETVNALGARVAALEDKVGKLEQAPSLEADVKKAQDAATRAEAAAKNAEEAAMKAETAEKSASAAEKKAETAEKKSAKQFELMQKK